MSLHSLIWAEFFTIYATVRGESSLVCLKGNCRHVSHQSAGGDLKKNKKTSIWTVKPTEYTSECKHRGCGWGWWWGPCSLLRFFCFCFIFKGLGIGMKKSQKSSCYTGFKTKWWKYYIYIFWQTSLIYTFLLIFYRMSTGTLYLQRADFLISRLKKWRTRDGIILVPENGA